MDTIKQLGVRGLNHLLRSENWAVERLSRHAGRRLRIDAGFLDICLSINAQGLFNINGHQGEPDVTLTLPSDILVRALFDRSKLFSSVKLGGSVDVAETLAFVFRNLKWDAEADLAAVIGDIPAHRLVKIGRSLADSLQVAARNTTENIREYAVEESAMLVVPADMASFGEAVNRLRDDVARLEKRLVKL